MSELYSAYFCIQYMAPSMKYLPSSSSFNFFFQNKTIFEMNEVEPGDVKTGQPSSFKEISLDHLGSHVTDVARALIVVKLLQYCWR